MNRIVITGIGLVTSFGDGVDATWKNLISCKIDKKFRVSSLHCSQRISNEQCMVMYERLALIERPQNAKPTLWKELILDDRQGLGKDSHSYRIKYDATPKEILQILNI